MAYPRSRRVSPGVTNAQNWYSHHGLDRITPRKNDTLTCMSNDVAMPAKFSVMRSSRSAATSSIGRWSAVNTGS